MVRLLVADAQYIVRMGWKELCRDMGDFSVEGEAANGEEALEALGAANFDMAVIDPSLPGQRHASDGNTGGINLINAIRAMHTNLPILVFTMNNDPETVNRVLSCGVSGFLDKNSNRETLETALRKIADGQNFISAEIAIKMMFEKFIDRENVPKTNLTPRESQILKLLGVGKSINAIADELFISSRTVSTHKMRLMQKMNFKNNAELFHYAHQCVKADTDPQGTEKDFRIGDAIPAADRIETEQPPHRNCSDTEPDLLGGA